MNKNFYDLNEVITVTGMKRSTIYHQIENGLFPKQVKMGLRKIGWRIDDIDLWLKEKGVMPRNNEYTQKSYESGFDQGIKDAKQVIIDSIENIGKCNVDFLLSRFENDL